MKIKAGSRFGHYEVVAPLGAGGMGEVYRATDPRLGRSVALKILSPELASDATHRARFQREAQAISALSHPNICVLYDIGVAEPGHLPGDSPDPVPFLVMELLEGRTLHDRMLEGPIPLDEMLSYATEIADALDAAHRKGIVHRDIKPGNVWITDRNAVKLLDFGLAQLNAAGGQDQPTAVMMTAPGMLLGTIRYMSPEQASGDVVGPATDIFSFGILLYEGLTGTHPFAAGSNVATARAIIARDAAPPSLSNPHSPGDLDPLLLRMLEKEPSARPSAAEVKEELRRRQGAMSVPHRAPSRSRAETIVVGRKRELETLVAEFRETERGRSRFVAVTGEPGIGKSTLIHRFLDRMATVGECIIAVGRCSERLAGTEAYLPWFEAVESMVRADVRAGRLLREFAPTWERQLSHAGDTTADREMQSGAAPPQDRMKREIAGFLERASAMAPLIFVLEDVHWADASTADLISFLAARHESLRLLLVSSFRPSELARTRGPFLTVHQELVARGVGREVEVAFLDADEVASYLDREFPGHHFPPEISKLIHEKTEGSPLFIVDVIRYMKDRGIIDRVAGEWRLTTDVPAIETSMPQSISNMIQRKLDQLSEEQRQLLGVAAAEGFLFHSAVVAKALGKDEVEIEDLLDDVEKKSGLIRNVGELELPDDTPTLRYRFVHVLYQNALYGGLGPARRSSFSRSVASALRGFAASRLNEFASELALLYEQAREFGEAAAFFTRAARIAARLYANQESEALARKGLESAARMNDDERSTTESDLLEILGDIAHLTARHGESASAYRQAFANGRLESLRLARLRRKLGRSLIPERHLQEALEEFGRAEKELLKGRDDSPAWWREWLQLHLDRNWVHYWKADVPGMSAELNAIAGDVESHASDAQQCAFYYARSLLAFRRDRYLLDDETVDGQRRAVEAARRSSEGFPPAAPLFALGFIHFWRCELDEAERWLMEGKEIAEKTGDLVQRTRSAAYLSLVSRRRGEVEESRLRTDTSIALARETNLREYVITGEGNLGWIAWKNGDRAEAERLTRKSLHDRIESGLQIPLDWVPAFPLLDILSSDGKREEAKVLVRRLLQPDQHRFPPRLEEALTSASSSDDPLPALEESLRIARELRYL
ncbi:MAG: protein kinase [Thermoanaerobaculia bacterium]